MKRVMLTCSLLGFVVLFGCSGSRPSAVVGRLDSPTATQPTKTASASISVLYAPLADPAPLASEQLEEIRQAAKEYQPDGREIWFILVLQNRRTGERPYYAVNVFFTPGSQSPRVRTGRYAMIDNLLDRAMRECVRRQMGEQVKPEPGKYIQVSAASQPFGARLMVPEFPLLPFHAPDHLTDSDVVQIVDVARSALLADDVEEFAGGVFRHPAPRGAQELPVVRIENDADLRVDFGWQVGGLWGRGYTVHVKRGPKGFESTSRGMWVS